MPARTLMILTLAAMLSPTGAVHAQGAAAGAGARLRIGVLVQAANVRMARTDTVVPARGVFMRGVEVEYRPAASPIGFAVRAHQSSLGGGDLAYGDASAMYAWQLGAPVIVELAADLALGWRTGYEPGTGLAHGKGYMFLRPGIRARAPVGLSPLSLELRVSPFVPVSGEGRSVDALAGWDGETGLRWSFAHWPIDAAFGYRFERFRVYRTEQEVSAVRFELAWRGTLGGSR